MAKSLSQTIEYDTFKTYFGTLKMARDQNCFQNKKSTIRRSICTHLLMCKFYEFQTLKNTTVLGTFIANYSYISSSTITYFDYQYWILALVKDKYTLNSHILLMLWSHTLALKNLPNNMLASIDIYQKKSVSEPESRFKIK